MKALIIDDVSMDRQLITMVLNQYGQCEQAANPMQAREQIESALTEGWQYDLITVDYMMPGTNGVALLKQIRQLESDHQLPDDQRAVLLVVSARKDDKTRQQVQAVDGCHFLAKPVRREVICQCLDSLGFQAIAPAGD